MSSKHYYYNIHITCALNEQHTLTSCGSTEHLYRNCNRHTSPATSAHRAGIVSSIPRLHIGYLQTLMCHVDPRAGDAVAVLAPFNTGLRIATIHKTQDKPSRVFCYVLLFGDIQKSWIPCMGERERRG